MSKTMPLDIQKVLSSIGEAQDKQEKGLELDRDDLESLSSKLREMCSSLQEGNDFKIGQIVTWKEGFRNRKRPWVGEPAIVIEVLKEPVRDDYNGSGHPYFREPLTVRVGLLDDDGDFMTFWLPGERLKLWEELNEEAA